MKNLLGILAISTCLTSSAFACSDIFINKGEYHIEGRSTDFLRNLAFKNKMGFVGQENITDVVLDADKIPSDQLVSWKNKYGYLGRAAFDGKKIIDGMNTEGFAVSMLYLPGSQFPVYDPKNHKHVLGTADISDYLLSQANTVSKALELIRSCQIVQSAVEVKPGYFVKDIPIHFVLRDKTGNSAVIEFTDGQVKIFENAGDVLTNAPNFDWQLKHAHYYDSLLATNKGPNPRFEKTIYDYNEIYKSNVHVGETNLIGTPGDPTPPSRFARAFIYLRNFPMPSSRQEALYQATSLIDALKIPRLEDATPTIWMTIKDLDERIYYIKDIGYFQGDGTFYPTITNGYTPIDLKVMDFKNVPSEYIDRVTQPTDPKNVKEIVSINDLPQS